MLHSFHVKKSSENMQQQRGIVDYDDLSIHEKIFYQKRKEPKTSRFHNPKTTRSQVLKEKKTQQMITERKMKEQQEQLQIEIRQEKIRAEQQRIRPTLRRIQSTMSSLSTLTKKDEIRSVEKRYKEWLLLKEQEHSLKQTMLAKLSGDYTTFSIEKAMTIARQQERMEAEQAEERQQQEELLKLQGSQGQRSEERLKLHGSQGQRSEELLEPTA